MAAPIVHSIHFTASINSKSLGNFTNAFLSAISQGAERIDLYMHTDGGGTHEGFGLYGLIRSSPVPVVAHNIGNIESMGIVMYLAADTRIANPEARFLIHGLTWGFGNGTVDGARLIEYTERLAQDRQRYVELFKERTNGAQNPIDISAAVLSGHLMLDSGAAAEAGITTGPVRAATVSSAVKWWVTGA